MNNCGLSHIVNVEIDDNTISGVAAARFAPLFGAIPLKRTIQSPLEKPLAKAIYLSMAENQEIAAKLDRPSCQDTGVIQYFVTAGAKFPLLGELGDILAEATRIATQDSPLRHNAVSRSPGGAPTTTESVIPISNA